MQARNMLIWTTLLSSRTPSCDRDRVDDFPLSPNCVGPRRYILQSASSTSRLFYSCVKSVRACCSHSLLLRMRKSREERKKGKEERKGNIKNITARICSHRVCTWLLTRISEVAQLFVI